MPSEQVPAGLRAAPTPTPTPIGDEPEEPPERWAARLPRRPPRTGGAQRPGRPLNAAWTPPRG
jgi:hypothetical protein